jgi:hypothetical protein
MLLAGQCWVLVSAAGWSVLGAGQCWVLVSAGCWSVLGAGQCWVLVSAAGWSVLGAHHCSSYDQWKMCAWGAARTCWCSKTWLLKPCSMYELWQ